MVGLSAAASEDYTATHTFLLEHPEPEPIIETDNVVITLEQLQRQQKQKVCVNHDVLNMRVREGMFHIVYHQNLMPDTPEWIKYLAYLPRKCIFQWGKMHDDPGDELEPISIIKPTFLLCDAGKQAIGVGYFEFTQINEDCSIKHLPIFIKVNIALHNRRLQLRPFIEIERFIMLSWHHNDPGWQLLSQAAQNTFQNTEQCQAQATAELMVKQVKRYQHWGQRIISNSKNKKLSELLRTASEPWQLAGIINSLYDDLHGRTFKEKYRFILSLGINTRLFENKLFQTFSQLMLSPAVIPS